MLFVHSKWHHSSVVYLSRSQGISKIVPQGPRRLRRKRGVYFPPLWTISIFLLYPKLPTWTKWEMCGWLNSNGRESATCQSGQSHTDSMLRETKKMWFSFLKTNDHTSSTHINDRICDIINERKSLQIIQRSDHWYFSAFSLSLFRDETFASNWISDIAIIVLWPSGERFGQSWKDYRQKVFIDLNFVVRCKIKKIKVQNVSR